jgi:transposase-like protein
MSIVAQVSRSDKSALETQHVQAYREELRETICADIRPVVETAFKDALDREVTSFLGRGKGRHRSTLPSAASDLQCSTCGCSRTLVFVRKGYYQRTQLTLWGALDISVPRVECRCGHCPVLPFATLTPYARLWSDVDELTLALVACDMSLRASGAIVRLQSGATLSIGTVQRRVRRVAVLAEWTMKQALPKSPPVVMLDGIWGTLMVDTGERKCDKRGRLRRVKKGVKVPLLIAQSIDPESGETSLLAWVEGKAENVADWTRLLTVLHERGVHAAAGLRLLISDGSGALDAALQMVDFGPVRHQRCIFHKLENVLRDISGDHGMTREQRSERVRTVLDEARAIYAAPTEAEARNRAAAFHAHWSVSEPKAVATLERDFDVTLMYYAVLDDAAAQGQAWKMEHLRTTSVLEGLNRSLRAKWRQACAFWSSDGWTAALWMVAQQRERHDTTERLGWLDNVMTALLAPKQFQVNFPTP